MKHKYGFFILIILLLTLLLSGCVPGDGSATGNDPAGFLTGIWHGWIAPISLIMSFFKPRLGIYEPMNTGFWYDFGFYIAILGGFGSFTLSRKKKKDSK